MLRLCELCGANGAHVQCCGCLGAEVVCGSMLYVVVWKQYGGETFYVEYLNFERVGF